MRAALAATVVVSPATLVLVPAMLAADISAADISRAVCTGVQASPAAFLTDHAPAFPLAVFAVVVDRSSPISVRITAAAGTAEVSDGAGDLRGGTAATTILTGGRITVRLMTKTTNAIARPPQK